MMVNHSHWLIIKYSTLKRESLFSHRQQLYLCLLSLLAVLLSPISRSMLRVRFQFCRRQLSTIKEWNESQVIVDRRSKFQARHVNLTDSSQIVDVLEQFLVQHKSIAKNASHPHMLAWRTGTTNSTGANDKSKKMVYTDIKQGFKDCGEKGAGRKILEVMESQGAINKLVIVTRWFGGSHIGSLRFRHIGNCTAETLRKAASKE